MSLINADDHLYLVDGSGYIFRAYHSLPPLTRKSDGLPVGAISGFCNMLLKLLDDISPTHLAVVFDQSGHTFRNDIYPAYKTNRDSPPEDLIPQFSFIRAAVTAFGIPSVELEGFEADDLIATYAMKAASMEATVTIISSDKDFMQLIGGKVDMLDTMKDKHIATEQVIEKFGVAPDKVVDVQALAGDSSDNIPGVPGIGLKIAAQLVTEYGGLDEVLNHAGDIKQNKRRENLLHFAEQARMCRQLVTLRQDVPLPIPLNNMRLSAPKGEVLIGFLKAMEFNSLTQRVAQKFNLEADKIDISPEWQSEIKETSPAQVSAMIEMPPIVPENYETVTCLERLSIWINDAYHHGVVAVDTETNGLDAMQCRLVGISLAVTPSHACYIPLGHGMYEGLNLEGEPPLQLSIEETLEKLSPLFKDASVMKILQNAKFDLQVLRRYGTQCVSIDDTMLMSYALGAGRGNHSMDALAKRYLSHETIKIKDILGKGKNRITFDHVPIKEATAYAAEDADVTLRIWYHLKKELVKQGVVDVYQTMERPLIPVIADMERHGVRVDDAILSELSCEFTKKIEVLEKQIYQHAGEKFNIASPKQLGDILFNKLGFPNGKKTKTGTWKTGANILENLVSELTTNLCSMSLPLCLLEWRSMTKLKSTYTDALPEFINPQTGRIHTSYSLAGTNTGRLSSSEPNLQNIPIRTKEGRHIRKAFVAEKGKKLLSADYSQIELRLLAHIADIPVLKQAFSDGVDIHAMTASEIFNIPINEMSSMVRRRAKSINFGIIYGISAFGLANQLNISQSEASDYIQSYFNKFPGIKIYMNRIKEEVSEKGYVKTIFGRKIYFPEIHSKMATRRSFSQRAAINAPIQGSAADIIRRAMIQIMPILKASTLNAKMLLQVHDELIFEVAEKETERLKKIVCAVMEQACLPRLSLSVPLIVDAKYAQNWDDAH